MEEFEISNNDSMNILLPINSKIIIEPNSTLRIGNALIINSSPREDFIFEAIGGNAVLRTQEHKNSDK